MPDPSGSSPTVHPYTAARYAAALAEECLAEDLAVLAAALEGQGCPCAAEVFRQASRGCRVQSLLHTAQAVAARATFSG
jgi:hypothetical protein